MPYKGHKAATQKRSSLSYISAMARTISNRRLTIKDYVFLPRGMRLSQLYLPVDVTKNDAGVTSNKTLLVGDNPRMGDKASGY